MKQYSLIIERNTGIIIKSKKLYCENCDALIESYDIKVCPKCNINLIHPKAFEFFNNGNDSSDIQEKIEFYDKSIEIDPSYAPVFNNRGLAHYLLHIYDKALADFKIAYEIDEKLKSAYYISS